MDTSPSSPAVKTRIHPYVLQPQDKNQLDAEAPGRYVQNLSLPIHQLPHHILSDIFALYTAPPDPHWDSRNRRVFPLMAVCRYWREIIRDTSTFWCKIVASRTGLDFMGLSLARSATAPIDVDVSVPSIDAVQMILPHAHRVRELRADDIAVHDLAMVEPLLEASMPILEDLALHANLKPLGMGQCRATQLKLSSRAHPRLRSLSLSHFIALPPDPHLYSNLRHLTIKSCIWHQTLDQFLDILAVASSTLESLELRKPSYESASEPKTLSPLPRRPCISLPRMKDLTLKDERPSRVKGLLANLLLPPTARVDVSCVMNQDWDHALGVGKSFKDLLGHSPRQGLLPLLSRTTRLEVRAHRFSYSLKGSSGADWESVFQYHWDADDVEDLERLLPSLLRDVVTVYGSAPLKHLSVVGGKHDIAPLRDQWKAIFVTFPTLETVTVTDGMGSAAGLWTGLQAASALVSTGGPTGDDSSCGLACPHLRRITVSGPRMRASREFFESALDCLSLRAANEARLKELDLAFGGSYGDGALASEYVSLLQTVVNQVRCAEAGIRELRGGWIGA
ncbi:hypothetical protein C8Q76DRAFT_68940 [Earliella scabrosa]|nr:hypothetical protein C8Q76DRAFT_68940 [Earliella scabrosa]